MNGMAPTFRNYMASTFRNYMDELCLRTDGSWKFEYATYRYEFINKRLDRIGYTQQELEEELQDSRRGTFIQMIKDFMEMNPMVISGTNSKTIFMDEIAITAQKFSDNDIVRIGDLKRRAKSLMSQMLQVQDPFFGMIKLKELVLAGGCFTSWYHGESPKDHDMFILDWTDGKKNLGQWPEQRYKVSDVSYLNAINLNAKLVDVILDKQTNIQYILTKYKTREELINHFDVEHACVSYAPAIDKLYISPLTFDCIKNKKLRPHNGNKIASWREFKFKQKGFTLETISV